MPLVRENIGYLGVKAPHDGFLIKLVNHLSGSRE